MSPSTTPATQNEGGCHQAPHLPRKVPRRHRRLKPAEARHQSQPSAISATPAMQKDGCDQVPRLPRKTKMHVTRRHACHPKQRWMSPSATPATQSAAASPATRPAQARHQSQPSAIKCHACHAKRRSMSPNATSGTQDEDGCHACHAECRGVTGDLKPTHCHKCHTCHVDVTKRHACHAKRRWM